MDDAVKYICLLLLGSCLDCRNSLALTKTLVLWLNYMTHKAPDGLTHSLLVSGIWSDGCWAFSTGLDQRIRFWRIDGRAQLTEHAHLIISVPEPESLDAVSHDR